MKEFYAPFSYQPNRKDYYRHEYDQPKLKLARAYVLKQPFVGLLQLDKALKVGTVFPNLYSEFPSLLDLYSKKQPKREDQE